MEYSISGKTLILEQEPGTPVSREGFKNQFKPPFKLGRSKKVEKDQPVWLEAVQTGLKHPVIAILGNPMPVPANQKGIPIGSFIPYGYLEKPWAVPVLKAWEMTPETLDHVVETLKETGNINLEGEEPANPGILEKALATAKEHPAGFNWSINTDGSKPGPLEIQELLTAVANLPGLRLPLKEDGTPRDFGIVDYPEDGIFLRFAGDGVITPTERQKVSAFITGYCLNRTYQGI